MVHEALDLAAIRARRAAITRAPWSLDPDSPWVLDLRGHILIGSDEFDDILDPENAAFIAAAPADVAALLARIAALARALEHATLVIENYELDIRHSEWTGVNLAAVGFCQGVIYRRARRTVQQLAQP